ncbi:MAG: hypothetical protein KAU22_03480, partial [Desulfuromonadales bacterium]|nr:hypothetical protein [Desulfuromonadales bacterium]
LVLLNKAGFSAEVKAKIIQAAAEFNGKIVGTIPFDKNIPMALQSLHSLADMEQYRDTIANLLEQIQNP